MSLANPRGTREIGCDALLDDINREYDQGRTEQTMLKQLRAAGGDMRTVRYGSWQRRIDLEGNPWHYSMWCYVSEEMG